MTEKDSELTSILKDKSIPWQWRFAVLFGIPAVLSVYFSIWTTHSVDEKLNAILHRQESILKEFIEDKNAHNRYVDEERIQTSLLQSVVLTQREICVNGIEPGRDTSRCFK